MLGFWLSFIFTTSKLFAISLTLGYGTLLLTWTCLGCCWTPLLTCPPRFSRTRRITWTACCITAGTYPKSLSHSQNSKNPPALSSPSSAQYPSSWRINLPNKKNKKFLNSLPIWTPPCISCCDWTPLNSPAPSTQRPWNLLRDHSSEIQP